MHFGVFLSDTINNLTPKTRRTIRNIKHHITHDYESEDETFFYSKEQKLLLEEQTQSVEHDFNSNCDFTEDGKYMIKSRVGYNEKAKQKKRIAAVNHDGLFELFKVKENGNSAKKSYKKVVLSSCTIEIFRRHREKSVHMCIKQSGRRTIEIIVCDEICGSSRIKTTEHWLNAFRHFAASCPDKLPPEVPARPTHRDRGFKTVKECKVVSRASKLMSTDSYHEDCVAGQLRVLLPTWVTRYVTLCSNGVLQVYKGTQSKSGIEHEIDLNEFSLKPDQNVTGSNFYMSPMLPEEYNQKQEMKMYSHPLSIDINQIEMSKRAIWMKYLSDFTPEKRRLERSFKSESVDSTPKLAKFSRSSTKTSLSLDRIKDQHDFIESDHQVIDEERATSVGYISPDAISPHLMSPTSTIALEDLLRLDEIKNSARPPLKRQPTVTLGEDIDEPATVPSQTKVENWIAQNRKSFESKSFATDDLIDGYMNSLITSDSDKSPEKVKPAERIRRVSTIKRPQRSQRTRISQESYSSSSTSSASEAWLSQSQASNIKTIATPHSILNSSSSQYFFPDTNSSNAYAKMEHFSSSYGKYEGAISTRTERIDTIVNGHEPCQSEAKYVENGSETIIYDEWVSKVDNSPPNEVTILDEVKPMTDLEKQLLLASADPLPDTISLD